MPKVSIIIPVYNVETYIRQCIDSVRAQTLYDIEIICVDDGSTDQCPKILDDYALKDARIKVIHKPNSGYGNSVNIGMAAATGEYCAILESDDVIVPEMYEELSIIGDFYDIDIVKGDFFKFIETDVGNKQLVPFSVAGKGMYNKVHYLDRDRSLVMKHSLVYTWCGIYRREFLLENHIQHNETPGASYQDNGFWFQTMSLAKTVYFVSKNYYCLRRDNPNSSIYNKKKVYCICDEYDFILDFLQQHAQIYEEVIPYYWKRLFGAYKFTLNRIADEYKEEFIDKFRSTLQIANDKKELIEEAFNGGEWGEVQLILNGKYYQELIKKQRRTNEPSTIVNRLKWCYEDNGFSHTVKHIVKRIIKKILPRFNTNNTVPKNILTRNEYYLLLDEIHGVECNLIVNYYRHKKKLESETSHVPIEKGNL